jgi:hypothetical protein
MLTLNADQLTAQGFTFKKRLHFANTTDALADKLRAAGYAVEVVRPAVELDEASAPYDIWIKAPGCQAQAGAENSNQENPAQ